MSDIPTSPPELPPGLPERELPGDVPPPPEPDMPPTPVELPPPSEPGYVPGDAPPPMVA